jgi:hypothetical protein
MTNTCWATGFDESYYKIIFNHVMPTWDLLPGDKKFYLDRPIACLHNDSRAVRSTTDLATCPDFLSGKETKFWRKSRSIVQALRESQKQYDYCIWLDADVRVLKSPIDADLLPGDDEVFSVNNKIIDNPPSRDERLKNNYLVDLGIDTGFLAFNLRHPRLDELIDIYENFWQTSAMKNMIRKYDTYALMDIVQEHNFAYRNLWRGINTAGKNYCGFEDSNLEQYFYHYWGKKNKGTINELA